MLKRASFQRLIFKTEDIYTVYNPSPEEKASFSSRFRKVSRSGTAYSMSSNIYTHIFIELFVHDYWIPIVLDLTKELKNANLSFSNLEIAIISKALQDEQLVIHVRRDISTNMWSISEQDKLFLFEKIKSIL